MLNEHVFLLRSNDSYIQKYVFKLLHSNIGQNLLKSYITGSAQGGLNKSNLKQIALPMPPLKVIKEIVKECSKIDEEYENTRMSIENYRKKIEELFNELGIISPEGR